MKKTAVIGAGKMGGFMARQLPPPLEILIIDPDRQAAENLAASLGRASAATSAAGAEAVILAVPAGALLQAARETVGVAAPGALIINVATSQTLPPDLRDKRPDLTFVEIKIIGNARAMDQGAGSLMVADTHDKNLLARLAAIFPGFGGLVGGDPNLAAAVNEVCTNEAIRTGVKLRRKLAAMNVPAEWMEAALESVAAGTLAAFAKNELGPFARALAERLEKEAE